MIRSVGTAATLGGLLLLSACSRATQFASEAGSRAHWPAAMERRVVFWDDRLDSAVQAKNQDRLVHWLAAHGFREVRSEELAAWMAERLQRGDAYGSVAVLTMGIAPAQLIDQPPGELLWVRYVRAGGRIVSVGDLPLARFEYPDARPLPPGMEERTYGVLGLTGGWNLPYWGRNLPVERTGAGRAWGFETDDTPVMGFPQEEVTVAFSTYLVPETRKKGAASWLKSLRPDLSGSGLLKLCQAFDGASDAQLRDVWRAASYVGKQVDIPALPPAWQPPDPAAVVIELTASGIPHRTEFARGEGVSARVSVRAGLTAERIRLELLQGARTLFRGERPVESGQAEFELPTSSYAYGAYQLRATALRNGEALGQAVETCGIRCLRPREFHWQAWVETPQNPRRRDFTFRDLAAVGMEPHLADLSVAGMDAALRQSLGFSLRCQVNPGEHVSGSYETHPEAYRLTLERKTAGNAYTGGRPMPSVATDAFQSAARRRLRVALRPVASHPGFRPFVLTNDDYSEFYGWDFSPENIRRFRESTRLAAPARKGSAPAGIVADDDPWLRWCDFSLRAGAGALGRAETAGAQEARKDVRVGPIPGGMQTPLVQMFDAAQYPPLNFGPAGFNLISCYYYNMYWQPLLTNTYWMEVGRLANRELPEWCMPDLTGSAGYTRSNLFHLLAGGVQGLPYFTYAARTPDAWQEIRRQAPLIRRIGPVQGRLRPAKGKDIGLLLSFTTACYDPMHPFSLPYGYHNLLQGHLDAEITSEEDVLAGDASRYRVILLSGVRWLRRSVADALAEYARHGGVLLLDATVPFDLPGARRLAVDVCRGVAQEKPAPYQEAGIGDYGHPERVALVRQALEAYVRPRFDQADLHLTATRLEVGGVSYVWFVNTLDGREYSYCRERMGAGHPGARTPAKARELEDWERREMLRPYTARPVFAKLPGVPYDLGTGRRLPVARTAGGDSLALSMDRFGGALVAFYPQPILRVRLTTPARVRPGQEVSAECTVLGPQAPIAGAVPVELRLVDPAGRESPLSRVSATRDGRVTLRWTPAANDAKGPWKVTARELASDLSASATLRLE